MLEEKVKISSSNDTLDMLEELIQNDYDAIKKKAFKIKFVKGYEELVVIVYGEKSTKIQFDDFVKHLNDHYIKGLG